MSKYAIEVDHVSMLFNMSGEKVDNIKEYFVRLVTRRLNFEEFWALRDVSFKVEKGALYYSKNGEYVSTSLHIRHIFTKY